MSNSRHISCVSGRSRRAFTLIEMLTVIAIIGVLTAIALPVIGHAITAARKTQAKIETKNIEMAINDYEGQYGHFPVSTSVQQSGWTNITCGGIYTNNSGSQWPPSPAPVNYEPSNSDVIAILMDQTNFPGGGPTADANHSKNSQQIGFLNAKMVGDAASPGVGTDLNYRDPWGNPYIISINLNGDNRCEDTFYASTFVSASTGPGSPGLYGLLPQADGSYAFHANVMVWSMGPNGPYYHSPSSFNASASATDSSNKNHILSWQ